MHLNDMAIMQEEQPDEHGINVKNVFDIAKQLDGDESESLSEVDDGDDDEPIYVQRADDTAAADHSPSTNYPRGQHSAMQCCTGPDIRD